jgi:hypothetical protein
LFGGIHAKEAVLAGLAPEFAADDALFFPLFVVGRDLALDELAERVAEHLVFFFKNFAHAAAGSLSVDPPAGGGFFRGRGGARP